MRQRARQRRIAARTEGARRQLSGVSSLVFLPGSSSSSSSPLTTRSVIGVIAVPACPFGRNPSISLLVSLLVFFLALSCQQLLSLHVSIQRSLISLTFSCMLFTPNSFLMSTVFTLSLSVTPLILINIPIFVFSRICSSVCFLVVHMYSYTQFS